MPDTLTAQPATLACSANRSVWHLCRKCQKMAEIPDYRAKRGHYVCPSCVRVVGPHISRLLTMEQRVALWTDKSGGAEACWPWTGRKDRTGYGRCSWKSRHMLAHRAAFTVAVGPIPAGLAICHRCDNPICVNPAHLFAATQAENMADMAAKGRWGTKPRAIGEAARHAKLSTAKIAAICADPRNHTEVARDYGVSRITISRVRAGITWRHVRRPELEA